MDEDEPSPRVVWFWVCAFFAVGTAIGAYVAICFIEQGMGLFGAICFGAAVGGYGAWFIGFVVGNLIRYVRRPP
jgi:hypothetical protein